MVAKRSHDEDEDSITSDELPCTAKLIRGESYNYKGKKYVKGEPRAVSREVAIYLSEQFVLRRDRDGESMEKEIFKITGLDDADEDDAPRTTKAKAKPRRPRA